MRNRREHPILKGILKKKKERKLRAYIVVNGEILTALSLRLGTRQGCPVTTIICHHVGSISQCNKAREGHKRHSN